MKVLSLFGKCVLLPPTGSVFVLVKVLPF